MTRVQHSLGDCTVCCVWGVLTLDNYHFSLAVTPLFWKKEKSWTSLNALQKQGEDLRYCRSTHCGVLPWATWNLQTLLFSWPVTCSALWNQIICSQSEMYRLEYTSGRVKLWVNLWNKGEVWCFLVAEDASVGIATRNILCLKNTDMWVLELAWKEQNLLNSSLILLPWLVRVRELTFINMEVILNALGRKEVIYSLGMWCSLNSSVGECSLWYLVSTGKSEILLPPWLEAMVNLRVLSLWSKRLTV